MLDAKDVRLVSALREGSRAKLKTLAKRSGIPLSTAHERLHKLARSGAIRSVPLIDYRRVGAPLTSWIALTTKEREAAKEWLLASPHVNTLIEVSNGADLLCEGVFTDFGEQHAFLEGIAGFGKAQSHPVITEVVKENAKIRRKETP